MAKGFSVQTQPGFVFVALLCFFLLYLPIATLVFYAFNSGVSVAVWEGFSFRWFQSAMQNSEVQEATTRSVFVAVMSAFFATIAWSPKASSVQAIGHGAHPGVHLRRAVPKVHQSLKARVVDVRAVPA